MSVSKTKEFCDRMNYEFTYSRWVWRQDALWNVSYFAGGWETWIPLDVVATTWTLKDNDIEAIKDCFHKSKSLIQVCSMFQNLCLHNLFNVYIT